VEAYVDHANMNILQAGNYKARDAIELHRTVMKLQQERQFKTRPVGPLCAEVRGQTRCLVLSVHQPEFV
jgi:hypothetical protein